MGSPIVCVVGFHHARYVVSRSIHWNQRLVYASGPEIESWFGIDDGVDPAADNDWSFLPFMALSDGAHA